MSISFPGRARIDATNPQALGICQRCGFQYNLVDLRAQMQFAGQTIINKNLLVCATCYDTPSEFLRTIRLPMDPEPVYNARIEPFAIDEKSDIIIIGPVGRPVMLAFASFSCEISNTGPSEIPIVLLPQAITTEAGDVLQTEMSETITVDEDGLMAFGKFLCDVEVA